MSTYKLHALGDYVRSIWLFGTTDNYSTQVVSTALTFYKTTIDYLEHVRESLNTARSNTSMPEQTRSSSRKALQGNSTGNACTIGYKPSNNTVTMTVPRMITPLFSISSTKTRSRAARLVTIIKFLPRNSITGTFPRGAGGIGTTPQRRFG